MNAVYQDSDKKMSLTRARQIAQRGDELLAELERHQGDDLPEWLQAKLEQSYALLDSAYDYLHVNHPDELEKAKGTKYKFKKRGVDKKTGKGKWIYTYNKPKTARSIKTHAEQAVKGASFVFHHKGQRGHFHVEAINEKSGLLTIVHDETGHSVDVTKNELKALLMFEHKEHLEAHAEAKAKRAKERGQKTKSGKHKGAENVAERARQSAKEAKELAQGVGGLLGTPEKDPLGPMPPKKTREERQQAKQRYEDFYREQMKTKEPNKEVGSLMATPEVKQGDFNSKTFKAGKEDLNLFDIMKDIGSGSFKWFKMDQQERTKFEKYSMGVAEQIEKDLVESQTTDRDKLLARSFLVRKVVGGQVHEKHISSTRLLRELILDGHILETDTREQIKDKLNKIVESVKPKRKKKETQDNFETMPEIESLPTGVFSELNNILTDYYYSNDNNYKLANELRTQIEVTTDPKLKEQLTALRRNFIDAVKEKTRKAGSVDVHVKLKPILNTLRELIGLKKVDNPSKKYEPSVSKTQHPAKKKIKTTLKAIATSKKNNVLKNGKRTRVSINADKKLIEHVETLLKEAFEDADNNVDVSPNERTAKQKLRAKLKGALNGFKNAQKLTRGSWVEDHTSLTEKRNDHRSDIYSAIRELDLYELPKNRETTQSEDNFETMPEVESGTLSEKQKELENIAREQFDERAFFATRSNSKGEIKELATKAGAQNGLDGALLFMLGHLIKDTNLKVKSKRFVTFRLKSADTETFTDVLMNLYNRGENLEQANNKAYLLTLKFLKDHLEQFSINQGFTREEITALKKRKADIEAIINSLEKPTISEDNFDTMPEVESQPERTKTKTNLYIGRERLDRLLSETKTSGENPKSSPALAIPSIYDFKESVSTVEGRGKELNEWYNGTLYSEMLNIINRNDSSELERVIKRFKNIPYIRVKQKIASLDKDMIPVLRDAGTPTGSKSKEANAEYDKFKTEYLGKIKSANETNTPSDLQIIEYFRDKTLARLQGSSKQQAQDFLNAQIEKRKTVSKPSQARNELLETVQSASEDNFDTMPEVENYTGLTIDDYPLESAINSYKGNSWHTERNGEIDQKRFMQILDDLNKDAQEYVKRGGDERYIKAKTEEYARLILRQENKRISARTGLLSSMIVGPAKFPKRRQEAKQERYDRVSSEAFKKINQYIKEHKKLDPQNVQTEKLVQGEGVAQYERRIEELEAVKARWKASQKIARDKSLSNAQKTEEMKKLGFKEGDFGKNAPLHEGLPKGASFASINAKIRDAKKSIEQEKERAKDLEQANSLNEDKYTLSSGLEFEIERDERDNRLRLVFDGKPDNETRKTLKSNGFRWSPRNGAWQRQLTRNALSALPRVLSKLKATKQGEPAIVEDAPVQEPVQEKATPSIKIDSDTYLLTINRFTAVIAELGTPFFIPTLFNKYQSLFKQQLNQILDLDDAKTKNPETWFTGLSEKDISNFGKIVEAHKEFNRVINEVKPEQGELSYDMLQVVKELHDDLKDRKMIKAMSELEKGRATKYRFKKLAGVDKKTGKKRWKYYYNDPKTARSIKKQAEDAVQGASFVFHHKGQRGHFHVEAINEKSGLLTIVHDETGHSVDVTKNELKALLMFEHSKGLEAHAEAKAKRAKERGRKTKSGTHKGAENVAERARQSAKEAKELAQGVGGLLGTEKKAPKKKEAKKKDNFETMPEVESKPIPARSELEQVTQSVKEEVSPSFDHLSDDELNSERKRKNAELLDQETLIDEAKRKRQPIKELRRQEKKLKAQKEALDSEARSRGKADVVPSQDAVKEAIAQLKAMIQANPTLANTPEVMAMLGSSEKKADYSDQLNTDLVITLDGKTQNVPVRYKIVEAGDAIGSHDPTGFFKRRDYPEDVQEREYHNRKGPEQSKVINQAKNLNPQLLVNTNPDAMNGPPILTQDGIALGGNSRVMSVQRAYLAHPKKAKEYKEYLKRKARTFGLDVQDLENFQAPLLVREYVVEDQSKENLAKLVRAMNEGLTQAFDPLAEGKATATKLLGENRTLGALALALREAPEGTTLNTLLKTSGSRLDSLKNALFADGILSSRDSNKYIDQRSGQFNDNGVAFVKKMILGYVIRDDAVLRSLTPNVEDHLETALVKLSAVGLNANDAEKLQNSIRVFNHLMNKDQRVGGITARMDPKERHERMIELMEKDQELSFATEEAEELDFDKYKDLVKKDPLSNAFLKILTLANTQRKLNSAMDSFIKLVDTSNTMDMFAPEPVDFTEASKQIANRLSKEYGVREGLFKSGYRGVKDARYNLMKALY